MVRAIIIFCVIVFSSCSPVLLKIYGLKNLKHLDNLEIEKTARNYHIPNKDLFILDSSYFTFLHSFDSAKYKQQIKNHSQPLQLLYFDKEGKLISFHINCYAGGFPNLKWNRNEILDSFIPKSQTPLDSMITFNQYLKYIKNINSKPVSFDTANTDYFILIYWNRFMGRQSKRLIYYVNKNLKLAGNKKTQTFYINTDNAYVDPSANLEISY